MVVRRPDSAIHWIAIFLTFVKLAVDRYNLRLRFGIYKLEFLLSIAGSGGSRGWLRGQMYKKNVPLWPLSLSEGLRVLIYCGWVLPSVNQLNN